MKTLHVQVLSGLGSRMRAVIGAIAWAKAYNAKVAVHWPRVEPSEKLGVFPVGFSELFKSEIVTEVEYQEAGHGWPKQIAESGDGWRIRSCEPEHFLTGGISLNGWPFMDEWRPTEMVLEHVAKIDLHGKVIGVHIRKSLAQPVTPPMEWFIQRMQAVYDQYHPRFFLACDQPDVADEVRSHFPDVLVQEKTYRYDHTGIARVAADLILLSQCDWMIGSYSSSFSELAGWMRGGGYLPGWGRTGWMPGGRYEDARTPPVSGEMEEALT